MTLESRFDIPPNVVARRVGDETVILDIDAGTYFGLDAVGARIWALIEEGLSLADICDILVEEYDAERETVETDTLRLASDLKKHDLVRDRSS